MCITNQNGRKNLSWLPISTFFVALRLRTFVLLNINREFGFYTQYQRIWKNRDWKPEQEKI